MKIQRVTVFCGSQFGNHPDYEAGARALATSLAERGIGVVFGGGRVGLMGAVADAALKAGGEVIGVLPRELARREIPHEGLTELHLVHSMHERKAKMAELGDAYVALPGGIGTLEEIAEILTWSVLGIHASPCALFDIRGYWEHLRASLDHAVTEGFFRAELRRLLLWATTPDELVACFESFEPPELTRWISPGGT